MSETSGILRGEEFLPLTELEARIQRAAAGLRSIGIGPGDAVGLLLRNDFEFFEVSYATSSVGAAPVPVNWHGAPDEIAHVLTDARVKAFVAHADLLPGARASIPEGVQVFGVPTPPSIAANYHVPDRLAALPDGVTSWSDWRDGFSPTDEAAPNEGATMIYTSGTTGRPKGVRRLPNTQDQSVFVDYLIDVSRVFGLWPEMRTVITGPMYHSAPNAYGLAAGRLYQGYVVLQDRFDAEDLLRLVEQHSITALHMVPTMFVRLLRLDEATRRRYDVSSLRHIVHAAAPCPVEVKRQIIEWFGPIVYEYYGGTESGLVVGCDSEEWLAHPGTVGKPFVSCTIKVVDEGVEQPTGEVGEIFMRAAGMPEFTYEGRQEARDEIARENLFTLGDVGYLDSDNFLFLCDRVRDMIIAGGVNIYPIEIEARLLEHPAIADCAVFGVPDEEFGEAIMAAVQRTPGTMISDDEVRDHVRGGLAGFKVPRYVEFLDELPREDSGKIFKRKLRAPYWEKEGRAI